MEEKPLPTPDQQKTQIRRSKKEQEGRDFQCGCGKRYLSYPALYTHIKTKHDGVQPEGTLKIGVPPPPPRKTKEKLQQQVIKQIQLETVKDDFPILTQLDQEHFGTVPVNSRITKQTASKQILDCYANILRNEEFKLTNTSRLDVALTVYIFNAGEYVSQKVYYYYRLFAKVARNCYYEHGDDIYKSYFLVKEEAKQCYLPTFSVLEVKYFPIVVDFLIFYYLPQTQNLKENEDVVISMLQLIIQDFCNWLFKKGLTNMKIKMIRDYLLTDKPSTLKVKKEEYIETQTPYRYSFDQIKKQIKYAPQEASISQVDEEEQFDEQQFGRDQKGGSYEENFDDEDDQQIQ